MRHLPAPLHLLLIGAVAASSAATATEVELTLPLLVHTEETSEADLDDGDVESNDTTMETVSSVFSIDVYAEKLFVGLNIDASGDARSGLVQGGYSVAHNIYAGLALGMENTKSVVEVSVDGGATTETETKDDSTQIGPFVHYRSKSDKAIIEGHAWLARFSSKTTDEGDLTDTFEVMGLEVGGDYFHEIADRFHVGAGLDYFMSLSGDAEIETATGDQEGDFKFTRLALTILQAKIDL